MSMTNKLPCLRVRTGKSQAYKNVVQSAFELCKQMFTSDALLANRTLKVSTELIFENSVDALYLLLLSQLQPVSNDLRFTTLPVLPRRIVSFFDSAGRLEAALPFEEQLHTFTPA